MPRPLKSETDKAQYLKDQFQAMETALNSLENICKTSNEEQKQEKTGEIGLLVGKLLVRLTNIEAFLGIYDD